MNTYDLWLHCVIDAKSVEMSVYQGRLQCLNCDPTNSSLMYDSSCNE